MIGVLSDAHGNVAAFNRAIELLGSRGAQRFIFLGDAVGYIPSPEVIAVVIALGERIQCVRGNHEDLVLSGHFDPGSDLIYQHRVTRGLLSAADLREIKSWTTTLHLELPIGSALFVHGSPAEPTNGYVYPDTDLRRFRPAEDFVFMGHTHYPFVRNSASRVFVNAGSCGLPRDHGSLGAAVLFDADVGDVSILRFDIRAESKLAVQESEYVHPSVVALFDREADSFTGELCVTE